MSSKRLQQHNVADAVALLFTEFPQHEGCSYEELSELLLNHYGLIASLNELREIYVPFYDEVVSTEQDFFEGYHG